MSRIGTRLCLSLVATIGFASSLLAVCAAGSPNPAGALNCETCIHNPPPPPPPPPPVKITQVRLTPGGPQKATDVVRGNGDPTYTQTWSANLSWTSTGGQVAFKIWRHQVNADPSVLEDATYTVSATGTGPFSFVDSGLADGSTITYAVYPVNAQGVAGPMSEWTVSTVNIPSTMPAATALENFEVSNYYQSVFPNIPQSSVVADLVNIINDPSVYVDQGNSGACGIATVEYELAKRNPTELVQLMQSIYYTGGFTTPSGYQISAGSDTRNSPVGSGVSAANWLFMATIRDALNLILPIDSGTSPTSTAWITTPAEESGMISGILDLTSSSDSMQSVLAQHGVVFALVNANLVSGMTGDWLSLPNHWIDITSFSESNGQVTLTMQTWGESVTQTVPESVWNTDEWALEEGT